ncbi:MAG: hypothetical protein NC132_01415 [Corallococcus sp.]|nr:hypothetical protein [Corallococcus sp.]MCM1359429.1 hypothetical protein [Corallococcus sp.]MCM1394759.1 hypothetical protein [Corallococcus sp.]
MIEKLRHNFNLTNVLSRIFFVLSFVFANWQRYLSATVLVLGRSSLWLGLAAAFLVGVIFSFILPLLINLVLNWAKLFSVPRAEYGLFGVLFATLGMFICGLLNLVNLFTPLFAVWGSVIFPFIALTISLLCFYKVTSRLYFNDVTRVYYFKLCLIVYAVAVVLVGVL